jgi:hypothetical protein
MPKSDSSFNADGYAPVADRITLFYQQYPAGRINTELVSRAGGEVTFKALVFREAAESYPAATGWAAEREGDGDVNEVACLENTETSAVGRALANLGFTASTRRPSREEMEKAERARRRRPAPARESGRGAELQLQANAALDLLTLLASAQRRGFSARRAALLRDRVNRVPALPPDTVRGLELKLRAWLRRRSL